MPKVSRLNCPKLEELHTDNPVDNSKAKILGLVALFTVTMLSSCKVSEMSTGVRPTSVENANDADGILNNENDKDTSNADTASDTYQDGDTTNAAEIDDVLSPWPNGVAGTEIGGPLMANVPGFEPSGVHCAKDTSEVFGCWLAGDDGDVARIRLSDGELQSYTNYGGDFEGIVESEDGNIYIADEGTEDYNFGKVHKLDPSTGIWNVENCFLDLPVDNVGGYGLEAITQIPEGYAPSEWGDGAFIAAGSQLISDIYVYRISDVDDGCVDDQPIEHFTTIPTSGTDISGLTFNKRTNRIYTLHDGAGTFDMSKLDGTLVETYTPPTWATTGQEEGIFVVDYCGDEIGPALADLVISVDKTPDGSVLPGVTVYHDFPVTCK